MCDEVWWLEAGTPGAARRSARGAGRLSRTASPKRSGPGARRCAARFAPPMRRGDGRAEIRVARNVWTHAGNPTMVWRSGEDASVRVTVRYHERGGRAGDRHHDPHAHRPRSLRHEYRTREGEHGQTARPVTSCKSTSASAAICAPASTRSPPLRTTPTEPRTIGWTMQSHSQVADSRYTAGVANLRAKVEVKKLGGPAVTSVPE